MVVIGVVLIGAIATGVVIRTRQKADDRAQRLLRAALEEGVLRPLAVDLRVVAQKGPNRKIGQLAIDYEAGGAYLQLPINNASVEMLDDGQRLWQRTAQSTAWKLVGPSQRRVSWPLLTANYAIRTVGRQRIAGVETLKIAVVNRRTGRLAEVFCIDPHTRLMLRRQTWDADGHEVMLTEVTRVLHHPRVNLGEELRKSELEHHVSPKITEVPLTDAQCETQLGFRPRRPSFVPSGYQEIGVYARVCPQGRQYAEVRYFDGLRILSIHERAPGGRGPSYGRGWGRHRRVDSEPVLVDQGLAKTVRYLRHDLRIFVTGDLTLPEIIQVVKSIP
ncbi:MAG: sigma-E factor regulatory protein RseB domain-containing protein [Candidatus Zipacnadales bacterium]